MRKSVVLLVGGILVGLFGSCLVVGGGALVWAHETQRGAAGFDATQFGRFETPTHALTSPEVDLGADAGRGDWVPFVEEGTVRVTVRAGAAPVFVGIGPRADVDRYLAATAHDELADVSFAPFHAGYVRRPGTQAPELPAAQQFWVAASAGDGAQTVTWELQRGDWKVVVMNADARPGVAVDASADVRTDVLLPVGVGLLVAGLLAGAAAVGLLVLARRRRARAPGVDDAGLPVPYPVRLDSRFDVSLSRWMWLLKGLLILPHVVVLAFLWVAVTVLTLVGGVAILFTGRYPRRVFDFEVGVLRWTWRVTFYALALGTDRYPPFTRPPPTPRTPPSRRSTTRSDSRGAWRSSSGGSRALPRYLVLSVFGGGLTWWTWPAVGGDGRVAVRGGLVGLLVVVAAVTLTVARRYPRAIFDFFMGMLRWTYRVVAYVALMRDEYPPFRLDRGGADPAGMPPPPPPPPADRLRDLVGAGAGGGR